MNGDIDFDQVLVNIADYVENYEVSSAAAYDMARYCLLDSLGCALEALEYPQCTKLLGLPMGGVSGSLGARVPGTSFQLDVPSAAFNIGCLVRWLDFNDTWVATQTCHPSDDVGPILAVADHLSRLNVSAGRSPVLIKTVLEYMIKAHEIQGVLGMENPLSSHGLDHSLFLKVAASATVTGLLGGKRQEIENAVSLAFFEPSLALHRYGSNTGPRKGWACAEAGSRAIHYANMALSGEPGYPQVLTHPKWGFNHVYFGDVPFQNTLPFGELVMTNVLFKIQCPVVIHAQSAIECAIKMHSHVRSRIDDISRIELHSHQRTKIIDKQGPLRNAADRDHCLQYAVAIALLHGRLTAADYEDDIAADKRIDQLRELMTLSERPHYTQAYSDQSLRQNPNAIQVFFKDGTNTPEIEVLQPIGHPSRRQEGIPALIGKFRHNVARRYSPQKTDAIINRCLDHDLFLDTPVHEFMDVLAV